MLSEEFNSYLNGTPYSLPTDEDGEKQAYGVQTLIDSIDIRQKEVQTRFETETKEVRDRVELMGGTLSVYESNRIEDTGLDLDETRKIIADGEKIADSKLADELAKVAVEKDRHLIDTLGGYKANSLVKELAKQYGHDREITQADIRSLHHLVTIGESFAGDYKSQMVGISGKHLPLEDKIQNLIHSSRDSAEKSNGDFSEEQQSVDISDPIQVHTGMQELVQWIRETDANPPLKACVAHTWLTHIHPFTDGNGRVARLLANLILLRASWPPLVIKETDRLQYIEALSESDYAGQLLAVLQIFVKSINSSLRQLEKPDLANQLFEADLQRNPEAKFQLWSHLILNFLNEVRSKVFREDPSINMIIRFVPRMSTFLQYEGGVKTGGDWVAKAKSTDPDRDYLFLLGAGTVHLDLDQKHSSIFFATKETDRTSVSRYKNHFDPQSSPFKIKEVAISPTSYENKQFTLLAENWNSIELGLEEASGIVADSILKGPLINHDS